MATNRKTKTATRRTGGRSARVRAAVLKATFEELADVGYGEFSFERVAERAGVHKTTVYRRWEDKESLILDAMLERGLEVVPIPDTGSLRSDLLEFGKAIVANVSDPGVEATMRAVASIGDRSSPLAEASHRFRRARLELASPIVERAIARGEISPDADPELLLEAIGAPIYFRLLLSDGRLDDAFVERLAELVAEGVNAGQTRRKRKPATRTR
jgi:AcrR family transcriptional regulator